MVLEWRKVNRIDFGMVDKVFIVVFFIVREVEGKGVFYFEINFIVVEIGFVYIFVMVVKNG